ncbi:hypothetical protein V8E52_006260 [Russula decolorans]
MASGYPGSNLPKNYNSMGGGSTNRQNVNLSQPGPLPLAKKGAHSGAQPNGAFITGDNTSHEINTIDEEMKHRYLPRGRPNRPTGVPEQQQARSSSTQPQTIHHYGAQTHQVSHAQAHQVPHPQAHQVPHPQTHQVLHAQAHQVPHPQAHQVSHAQAHQVSHPQTHQVPHPQAHQVSHAQAHQLPHAQAHQVSHGQTQQVSHAQAHQVPHAQAHQLPQVAHGQTYQPTQVQMPRAPEGGTSSHNQQRSADSRRRHDRIPAVTANWRTTAG